MQVTLYLTGEGVRALMAEVAGAATHGPVGIVYQALGAALRGGLQEWRWRELADVAAAAFRCASRWCARARDVLHALRGRS